VVVAIIALLLAILLPNLAAAREQGRRAKCLSNLKNIASSSFLYAAEDSRNLVIPIHQGIWSQQMSFGTQLWWRLGGPTSFGGKTPVNLYGSSVGGLGMYYDPNGPWNARTRPLNRYLFKDNMSQFDNERAYDMFACPSDDGLPENHQWVVDNQIAGNPGLTSATYEKRMFDLFGNSYRFNTIGQIAAAGQNVTGSFSSGVFGSKSDRIDRDTGRVVLYSEPLFYLMTVPEQNLNPGLSPIKGQHTVVMTENCVYADGSGRPTRVGVLARFNPELLTQMGYGGPADYDRFLRRGTTWQTDSYPTAGSLIRAFNNTQDVTTPGVIPAQGGWPGRKYQDNLRREF
jgi:hypothetical protein